MTARNYNFVSNITSEIGSGTGLPAVSELSDAVITTPANNDVLTYETATSKWKNKPVAQNLNDLADVDIDAAADGEALIKSGSTWIGGASGDASFKVSYLSGSTLSVKAGGILHNGAEYRAYAGTNTEAGLLAANLTVTPTVSASASYYLYIDTSAAVAAGLLTSDIGREYYGVTDAMFMSSESTPSEVDTTRYIPIGVYTTDASSNIVSTKVGNVAPRSVDSWSNIKLYEDKIVARYTSNGGEAFPTTTPIVVDFETANISSPYITTGSGWKFTAPRNGKYQVSVNLLIDPVAITADDVLYLYLFKGGVSYTTLTRFECGVTTTVQIIMNLSGTSIIELLANEYIDIRIEKVGTTSFNVRNSSVNSVAIHEITNYPTSSIATPTNTPFAILTANPTPDTTGCVSGYERVLVDSSIHDQMNCEAFYWDASDTNASWEKKTDAPMMVHNGFIAMLSSYIDALDWATGDKLKIIAGNGARINAIPESLLDSYNLIINAAGIVNQRGYVSGTATSGANQYTLDRWRVVTSGQNLTFSKTNGLTTMTAPAGGVEQVIEGGDLQTGMYNLSWVGTATGYVNGTAIANGSSIYLVGGSNITIKFVSGTFTNVVFTVGNLRLPYKPKTYAEELRDCQRFCYKIGHYSSEIARLTVYTANNIWFAVKCSDNLRTGVRTLVGTFAVSTITNVSQSGFTFSLTSGSSEGSTISIVGTKTSHSLTDAVLLSANGLVTCEL